jgi:pimeloyl-ACP methyl ester carboxylesterase
MGRPHAPKESFHIRRFRRPSRIRPGAQGRLGGALAGRLAITDEAEKRADIDATRAPMMGGSFGGYMANRIAGHTDRLLAIVSHAGLWALDQLLGTTDVPVFWRRTFGDFAVKPERYLANSPHLHADKIVTPILIIHGDKDYRVPVGEALRMWWDLSSRSKTVRFLHFPDESHWILEPGDVEVWYQTILAFLAEHPRGKPGSSPSSCPERDAGEFHAHPPAASRTTTPVGRTDVQDQRWLHHPGWGP